MYYRWSLIVVVQSLSLVQLFAVPWTAAARPPCPSPSRSLPKFMFIALVTLSSHLILWFPLLLCPQSFQASVTFPMSHLCTYDQNTGASASASVLPVNSQDWSSLRSTGLISLLSKGLSGAFSSTTVQRHQYFGVLLSLRSSSHNCSDLGRPQPWLYGPLSAEQCLWFSTHSLGLSSLSCQEAIIWFHGCSHHPHWFWSPRRGNLSLCPPFPLLFAIQ